MNDDECPEDYHYAISIGIIPICLCAEFTFTSLIALVPQYSCSIFWYTRHDSLSTIHLLLIVLVGWFDFVNSQSFRTDGVFNNYFSLLCWKSLSWEMVIEDRLSWCFFGVFALREKWLQRDFNVLAQKTSFVDDFYAVFFTAIAGSRAQLRIP